MIELEEGQVVHAWPREPLLSRRHVGGRLQRLTAPGHGVRGALPVGRVQGPFFENGVTTVGQYPRRPGYPRPGGRGPPPRADSAEEMIVEDGVYLKVVMRNNSSAKRNLRDGFKKADDHLKKVEKEREKFDKAQAPKAKGDKKKSSSKSKSKETFVPPPADPRVQPFFDLREGKLPRAGLHPERRELRAPDRCHRRRGVRVAPARPAHAGHRRLPRRRQGPVSAGASCSWSR